MSKPTAEKHKITIPKDKSLNGKQRRQLAETMKKAKMQGKVAMSA